jgi:hypothetical protein
MQPSTELCRSRAAHHRELADASNLDNVRTIALAAATAWDKEGALAVKREARVLAGKGPSPDAEDADGSVQLPSSGPECD